MQTNYSLDPRISSLQPLRNVFLFTIIVLPIGIIVNVFLSILSGILQAVVWIYFAFTLYRVGNFHELKNYGNVKITSFLFLIYGFFAIPGVMYNNDLPNTEEEIIARGELTSYFNNFILLIIIQTIFFVFAITRFSKWFNNIMEKIRVENKNYKYTDINSFKYSAITLVVGNILLIVAINNLSLIAEIIYNSGSLSGREKNRLDTMKLMMGFSRLLLFSFLIQLIISFRFYYNKLDPDIASKPRFETSRVLFGPD